jgi:hypothetical protein
MGQNDTRTTLDQTTTNLTAPLATASAAETPRRHVPFNKPHMTGDELRYIAEAHAAARLSGDGQFTKRCHAWLEENTGCHAALLTHSCTAALEMSALLADVGEGDEVIMPSFVRPSWRDARLRGHQGRYPQH